MKAQDVCCPEWLKPRLEEHGNSVPFSTFMDWALHDPEHGAYGSGHLQLGVDGDFVTSPSLGEDFCSLLAVQLHEWLELLAERRQERLRMHRKVRARLHTSNQGSNMRARGREVIRGKERSSDS